MTRDIKENSMIFKVAPVHDGGIRTTVFLKDICTAFGATVRVY